MERRESHLQILPPASHAIKQKQHDGAVGSKEAGAAQNRDLILAVPARLRLAGPINLRARGPQAVDPVALQSLLPAVELFDRDGVACTHFLKAESAGLN